MVPPKLLVSTIESVLLGPASPTPLQRIELMHALRNSVTSFQSLLSYPPPKASDRAQVQSKEVRLPDSPPISLDDQDVQIALKLSEDLHLNEIDCVRLLVSTNQEWGLLGREPLEILRLAAGIWYNERKDLLTALYTLLRAVVLDREFEGDLVADIQKYLEDLIDAGLRQRLIDLIKELNREEPAGWGGPQADRHVIDSRGVLVEREAVVSRERLTLGHCIVLSVLIVRISPKDVKDVFAVLKDCATEVNGSNESIRFQVVFSLLFSLIIAFISDALSTVPDKASVLSHDAHFRQEFQEMVIVSGNDPQVDGFVNVVRFAWTVHLMLAQDDVNAHLNSLDSSSNNVEHIYSCLEVIYSKNAFQFLLDKILRTAAYQNDDEDMIYMYNAYLHKMLTCFLSHPLARDKVKEMKEKAMTSLSPYSINGLYDNRHDSDMSSQQTTETSPQPFVSLMDLVSEVYQKEPELMSGNEVLWTFVNFAGEDHTNFQTLVAFLRMLSTLASSQEGASKVFDLLQGKSFRSVGWSTLFDCLSIYDQKFKQSLQSAGAVLPDFEEGDAKALVAYLDALQKVLKNGNPIERKNWFPDIEPLFKLLSYENVPPYLKGALRSTIAIFLQVFPTLKDTVWSYLEQYDLPVVVGLPFGASAHQISTQVYDMRFELNEVEARRERYPSTVSFLNLLNALIAEERDVTDRGHRFVGIFRFVYDHVFGPFPQRAYADPSEKWELVVACLQHFRLILGMYDIKDEDSDVIVDYSQPPAAAQSTSLETQIPVLELLKDFMSGKTVFRNIMSILLLGVNSIIIDRTSQVYGQLLEKAVQLCLEILILVFEKDLFLTDFWRPMYQPLDTILSQDQNHIITLLEYVRYYFQPQIQQCSIKIMSILSSRMVGLVQLLLKSSSTKCLIEDYAACLDLRSEECHVIENITEDIGVLVIQLLIDNIHRPAPNITHFLLKFEVDMPVDRTILQPKYHYSCLKVILDILDKFSKPDVNALLHEFGFQLLYELCLDPLTCGPTMDLLSNKKYQFFLKHLHTVGVAPLPKRSNNQTLRVSSLHQRAWLLKLLALELHTGDMTVPSHREACQIILTQIFSRDIREPGTDAGSHHLSLGTDANHPGIRTINKSKVLELLEVLQFRSPDTSLKYSQFVSNLKYGPQVESILGNPATSGKSGVYYYSERGDRLIDITSFRDKLWQFCSYDSESELNDLRETIQRLLRWCWKYNRNLEEQAAQLHMLTGWSHIVEISISRRMSSLDSRSEILLEVLDASLSSSASPDCSLKMSLLLSQVALTCMAKLRDERFTSPRGIDSDNFTSVDVILAKQLSNGACHSILFKLVVAILRQGTSELLRRRQYALLLSYFQYCQHMLDPDVPASVLQYLLREDQDGEEYMDFKKVDKEQAELARANFSILKKEAQAILNLVTKDAVHGSEAGKTISFYVLDAFISIDQERFFLGQLQSREFLRSCLADISNITSKDGGRSLDSLQRVYTLEAELALLLRISHKYGKSGSQVLFSMGALGHLASCKVGGFMRGDVKVSRDVAVDIDTNRLIIGPILRLVYSLISLVDTSEFFEVKNKIVREAIDFIKAHQLLIDQILRVDVSGANESTLELTNLVVGVLGKVWPYEEYAKSGFVQGLFGMMATLFLLDVEAFCHTQSLRAFVNQRKLELLLFNLCFSLSSYLYVLVTKKSLRLQVLDNPSELQASTAQMQPRLASLVFLLNSVTLALERASEEKSLLLNKIQDINELSRQEVDEVISMCVREDCFSSSDNIHKRRYIAMVEMCQVAGNRDQLIALLLSLAEQILNIVLVHFRDSSGTHNSSESTKMITYGAKPELEHDISSLCGKLLPTVEKLEALSEEKVGHNLKVFRRLLSSLKEMTIQNLSI